MHAITVNWLNFPCRKHFKSTPKNKTIMSLTILKWFARILAILCILFMLMFSLDAFSGNETFARKMLGFLMHNIPVFGLIIALVIAWRYEIAGGVLFVISFVALGIFFKSFAGNGGSLIIIVPLLVAGISFIVHGILSPKKES